MTDHGLVVRERLFHRWGHIVDVTATADNQHFVVCLRDRDEHHRLVFDGRVVANAPRGSIMRYALSFSGRKLAVVTNNRRSHPSETIPITINDKVAYHVAFDVLHRLVWLDNDQLAWEVWNRNSNHNRLDIRRFVNGRDVTDELDFDVVLGHRDELLIEVTEGENKYVIRPDGTRSTPRPKNEDVPEQMPVSPFPVIHRNEGDTVAQVLWRGVYGPGFADIESIGGCSGFAQTRDGQALAYIGVRYPKLAESAYQSAIASFGEPTDQPPSLWQKTQMAFRSLLFVSPLGLADRALESARRYQVVNGNEVWKKGYRHASDPFFTKWGRLVVTCVDQEWLTKGVRVVMDEIEGPLVDRVWNVRELPSGAVTYLALYNQQIFLVITGR